MRQIRGSSLVFGGGGAIIHLFMLTVLGYGAHLVQLGLITTGTLTSFIMYSVTMSMSSMTLVGTYAEIMRGVGASKRVFEILDRQTLIPSIGGKKLDTINGLIQFNNVNFCYPTRVEDKILTDFNINVEPGKSLAVVGASGSGKSTLMHLLLRMYDIDSGNIQLDGHDITELDPTYLRQNIAIVPQEPVLFGGTIFENICFGLQEYDENDEKFKEKVIQCAKDANCHEFIENFPNVYYM